MRSSAVLALAAVAKMAAAHTTLNAIWINGVDQGLGNSAAGYIRTPPNNDPIKDVTSAGMTCNVNNVATAKTIEVKSGDKITLEWHHDSRSASDDIIASSHHGPILTYIAPTASNGAGDVWVKLAESGFAGGVWAVDTLISNKGKHDITIPDLAAGEYLIRDEIIALHEANRAAGAQFYMECVQIKVTSAGAKTLPAGVAIPGTYTATDAGILFDIYNSITSYPIPGPAVWDGASGSGSPAPAATSAAPAPISSKAPVVSSAAPAAPAVTAKPAVTSKPAAVQTTLVTLVRTSTTAVVAAPAATAAPSTGTVAKYGQCGGKSFTGATACAEGWTCKEQNPYYSQCLSA